jgi:hypothetical protein
MILDITDLRSWIRDHAYVLRPDGTGIEKIALNRAQRRALTVKGLRGQRGYHVLLKARQLGFTLLMLLVTAWACFRYPGISILWVTPVEDPIGLEIIHKWRTLLRVLAVKPGSGWIPTTADSYSQTTFSNGSRVSWCHIGGSESTSDAVGRAGTFAFCVLTEFGFPTDAEFARGALAALDPALERIDAPVIIDSTPGQLPGAGEAYRDLIHSILDGARQGSVTHFGWWEYEGYTRQVRPSYAAFAATLTGEEIDLIRDLKLTLGQIAWRREKLAPRDNETPDDARRRFQKAYPETVREALIEYHEGGVFPALLVRRISQKGFEAPLTGLQVAQALPLELHGGTLDLLCRPAWGERKHPEGYCRIWKLPEAIPVSRKGSLARSRPCYFAGIDCSDGLPGGDWQSLKLLDRLGDCCVSAAARIDKMRWAALCQRLLTWYGAMAHLERQHGELVFRYLTQQIGDAEILANKAARPGELEILRTTFGNVFLEQTHRGSRTLIVDAALELLSDPDWCPDPETLQEMTDFIRRPSGRLEARGGAHDDRILATGFAGELRNEMLSSADSEQPRRSGRAARGWPGRKGPRTGRRKRRSKRARRR